MKKPELTSANEQNLSNATYGLFIDICWIGLIRYLFATDRGLAPEGYNPLYAMTLGYSEGPEAIRSRSRREGTVTWF